jgi:hypothetical protein
MQPFKLLACLVTLQLTSSLTLKAADVRNFREWTDDKGRQITARLLDMPTSDSVRIERQDGRVFTIPVKTFSQADQTYVKTCYAAKKNPPASAGASSDASDACALTEADASTWKLINACGDQPASMYENTGLDTIIADLNQRFAAKGVKTSTGVDLQIRTEPSDLAGQVKITGELPSMNMTAFLKRIVGINNLAVKTDTNGMVVLTDLMPPQKAKPVEASLFGVPTNPN